MTPRSPPHLELMAQRQLRTFLLAHPLDVATEQAPGNPVLTP